MDIVKQLERQITRVETEINKLEQRLTEKTIERKNFVKALNQIKPKSSEQKSGSESTA